MIAVAAIEDRLRDDARDPDVTIARVASLIGARETGYWREVFARADCCRCPIASLEGALCNPHVVARALFEHRVRAGDGRTMPALPVPVAPGVRDPTGVRTAPTLGDDRPLVGE